MADVKWTWQQAVLESDVPSTLKLVLLVVGCHMNQMGEGCYPSLRTLAKKASLSLPCVHQQVALAAEMGWLRIEQHGLKGQKWRRNEYFATWPEAVKPGLTGQAKVLNVVTEGVKPDSEKVLNVVERTSSVNHQENLHVRGREGAARGEWVDPQRLGELVTLLSKTRGTA